MPDVVIRGGLVVDGTGAPGRVADVAVTAGRISAIGRSAGTPERTIDAHGLVVAPGFVDLHTHYDAQLMWDPTASPSVEHGVTSVILGSCGFTLAPVRDDQRDADYLARMMAMVEGIPLESLQNGMRWEWSSMAEYLDRLAGRTVPNVGCFAGHAALRRLVMGDDATRRPATPAEIDAMEAELHAALAAGAMGFSTTRSATHLDGALEPVPPRLAADDEMLALAAAVSSHPGTSLELTPAGFAAGIDEDELHLMIEMSRRADRAVMWDLLVVRARDEQLVRAQLAASERAREQGARIVAQVQPCENPVRLSFATGAILRNIPGWADLLFKLPVADRIDALRSETVRERLRAGALLAGPERRDHLRWEQLTIRETFARDNASFADRTVGEVAAAQRKEPFEALVDLVILDDLQTGVESTAIVDDDASWALRAEVWRSESVVLSGADSGAHLDIMCGAAYPTQVLADVREKEVVTLEEGVRLLTDVPSRLIGLRDRGRLAVGAHADLILFDAARIGRTPARVVSDMPGGGQRLLARSTGVEEVLVGGETVWVQGHATGIRPGHVLRSGHDTDTVFARNAR